MYIPKRYVVTKKSKEVITDPGVKNLSFLPPGVPA
jgi:hypothetical protein